MVPAVSDCVCVDCRALQCNANVKCLQCSNGAVMNFALAILHGDDAHRSRLMRAAQQFIACRSVDKP